MITALAWASLLLFIFLVFLSGLPEFFKRVDDERHDRIQRRTPKQAQARSEIYGTSKNGNGNGKH